MKSAAGDEIGYGTLVWAAGGAARGLSCAGADLAGVHTLRDRPDVDRIIQELKGAQTAVVIGGGYIGLEASAVLRKLGKSVTLLESCDRVLSRVAGETLSRFYELEHAKQGVAIRLNVTVESIEGQDGRVVGVRLSDGELVPADLVIVGIGIVPSVQALLEAGAEGRNGVNIDRFGRSSLPDVYALGDCAAHENVFADLARIRLESVQNATDQALVSAKAIMGVFEPYNSVPWFWSDQYDLKLKTVGLSNGHDETVIRGETGARSFSVVYLKKGRIIALDCVNNASDFVQGRALLLSGVQMDKWRLADTSVPLKALHRA